MEHRIQPAGAHLMKLYYTKMGQTKWSLLYVNLAILGSTNLPGCGQRMSDLWEPRNYCYIQSRAPTLANQLTIILSWIIS
jgi:hypothetical protein